MSSALKIFFRNLEYHWKDDEEVQEDEQADNPEEEDYPKNRHSFVFIEAVTNPSGSNGDDKQANARDDDGSKEDDESSCTSSVASSSTTSTTKSLRLSAFHIQIVADNACSNCSQNLSNSGNQFTGQELAPKRRHSTPPSPHDCVPRRPHRGGPGYPRSSSSGSLLLFQRPLQKHPSLKQRNHSHGEFLFHHDAALDTPSFFRPHHRHHHAGGSSSCSTNLTNSRWHSGDHLLPAQTKSPLIQPIRRNISRDDISVETSMKTSLLDESHQDDDDNDRARKYHTKKLMFMDYQCTKHCLHNNDLAGILSSGSLFRPVGGCGSERSNAVTL